jgi:hypothetical protein
MSLFNTTAGRTPASGAAYCNKLLISIIKFLNGLQKKNARVQSD